MLLPRNTQYAIRNTQVNPDHTIRNTRTQYAIRSQNPSGDGISQSPGYAVRIRNTQNMGQPKPYNVQYAYAVRNTQVQSGRRLLLPSASPAPGYAIRIRSTQYAIHIFHSRAGVYLMGPARRTADQKVIEADVPPPFPGRGNARGQHVGG